MAPLQRTATSSPPTRTTAIFINAANRRHQVLGNYLGVNATDDRGNREHRRRHTHRRDTAGGTRSAAPRQARNIIANASGWGVNLQNNNTDQNSIRGNSIYSNTSGGINLPGQAQDANDADTGANQGQNYPDFTAAAATVSMVNGNLTFSGMTLNAKPNSSYNIDFYANPAVGTLQGKRYLGTLLAVATDGAGNITNLVVTLASKSLQAGDRITATATGVAPGTPAAEIGNTSPMSTTFLTVPAAGTLSLSGTVYEDVNGDGSIADGVGRNNVTVRLYADNGNAAGNGVPDTLDQLVATTTTNAAGLLHLQQSHQRQLLRGRRLEDDHLEPRPARRPRRRRNVGRGDVRHRQQHRHRQRGRACGRSRTTAATSSPRRRARSSAASIANRSDDGITLSATTTVGAEHIQLVSLSNANVTNVNSAYSFNAVVNNRGDNTDNDASNARMQQGTLRQFLLNSNAITGVQTSELLDRGGRRPDDYARRGIADDQRCGSAGRNLARRASRARRSFKSPAAARSRAALPLPPAAPARRSAASS